MSARTKSPLHPSALSLNDMNVGRRIIRFSLNYGIGEEGRIIRGPYVQRAQWPHYEDSDSYFKVDVLCTNGRLESLHLSDMGVIPYSGPNNSPLSNWHKAHFTIDVRKRALLPEISRKFLYQDDLSDEYGYDERLSEGIYTYS